MQNIQEKELPLLEKSIKAIKYSIDDLRNERYDQAIQMYNTVLKGYETFKSVNQPNLTKGSLLQVKLSELHKKHEEVVKKFENNEWNGLDKLIEEDILKRIEDLQYYVDNREYYEKYNINVLHKYYKMFKENGYLEVIDDQKIEAIQTYYKKHYKGKVDPSLHLAYEKITGEFNLQVIPQHVIWHEVIPFLNSREMMRFYSDKNVYDNLITKDSAPETVLKRVNGQYYDRHNNTISRSKAFKILFDTKEDLIVKQSLSDDGKGIGKLTYKNHAHYHKKKKYTMKEIEEIWKSNFIVQKLIKQHSIMANPHPYSVNTVRVVTLRWNDEIHYLMSYARFGVNYSLTDNAASDGLCVGISPDGTLKLYAVGNKGEIYDKHPTTGYDFSDFDKIPNFNKVIDFAKDLHNRILHHNYISWDLAIDNNGEPIFIEMNFWGTAWKYQLACGQSIFGEFTEEILQAVAKQREEQLAKQKDK
ncbi:sugar-transfer associated ATP-grasp domain-containing protein [Alkalibacillus silvisoli]|uniref:Alpha-L-glutamate ligase-related protein ATP-grasp domain-containing protein n=1 Tax=Alkalibacillus silvisoli TaxID=392823 RepID=A0ABP3K872_9BACI